MKYPKLFDGSHAIGEALVRSFDRSTPYLTIQAGEARARKQGAFRSVSVEEVVGDPFIATQFFDVDDLLRNLNMSPYKGIEKTPALVPPFGVDAYYCSPYRAYVGDDYIVSYRRDIADYTSLSAYYWFVIEKAEHPTPMYLAGDPEGVGKSTDLYPDASTTGLNQPSASVGMIGIGYRDAASRYAFAVSWLQPAAVLNGAPSTWAELQREPRMAIGSTATQHVTAVSPPFVAGHAYYAFHPIATGKGEIQFLQLPQETYDPASAPFFNVFLPVEDPSIVYSTDYGASWGEVDATFLIPFLNWYPNFVGMDRRYYSFDQGYNMGRYSAMFNLGAGKVLLIIANAMRPQPVDEADPNWGYWAANADFNPAAFIADKHTNAFTRLSWDPDDWCVDAYGRPRPPLVTFGGPREPFEPTYQLGLRRMADLRQAHFVYGEGCFYMPVIPYYEANYDDDTLETTGWKIMFTTDFGSTWQYSTLALPDTVQNVGSGCPVGTVLKPYTSAEKPGQILFTGITPSGVIETWTTTGLFDSWKKTNSEAGAAAPSLPNTEEFFYIDPGIYGVNYGDGKDMRKSIYPAFPGEFEA